MNITKNALFSDMPKEFITIYDYIVTLKELEDPDYSYILGIFFKIADKCKILIDNIFDFMVTKWTLKTNELIHVKLTHGDNNRSYVINVNTG